MRLSIIILTWNQRRLTMDCLASLGALTSNDQVEVIVVDNASTDGTA
ncbi:MAG: glycosyltransferase, partial [Muribaculaceae bacterium]|nr:glycosyltransferase [Muribaculaceae bacterium]